MLFSCERMGAGSIVLSLGSQSDVTRVLNPFTSSHWALGFAHPRIATRINLQKEKTLKSLEYQYFSAQIVFKKYFL